MRSVGRRAGALFVAVMSLAGTACSDGSSTTPAAGRPPADPASTAPARLPLADEALDDPDVTTVATDLAPSQVVASTVPEPPTPDPCTLDDVEMWTARVDPIETAGGVSVRTAIRIRNLSDVWCEPDVGRSPRLDPRIEPDVWLRPGDESELWVGDRQTSCSSPRFEPAVQIAIGDESTLVPTIVLACEWWLDAFLPLEHPSADCDAADLDVLPLANAVLAQTRSEPCRLPEIVAPDQTTVEADPDAPAVRVLRPGDVVMLAVAADESCDDPDVSVELDIGGRRLTVDGVQCGMQWFSDAAHPWFGSAAGPTPEAHDGALDLDATVAALDPFA